MPAVLLGTSQIPTSISSHGTETQIWLTDMAYLNAEENIMGQIGIGLVSGSVAVSVDD